MKQQYIHLCAKEYIDGAIWAITTFSKQLVRINVKTGEANIELELMEEAKKQMYSEIVGLGISTPTKMRWSTRRMFVSINGTSCSKAKQAIAPAV